MGGRSLITSIFRLLFLASLALYDSGGGLAVAQPASASSTMGVTVFKRISPDANTNLVISKAIDRTLRTGSSASQMSPQNASAFAELILETSSVDRSKSGRFAVLYSTFADLFTILQYRDGVAVNAFLASGEPLGRRIGGGTIKEEAEFERRFFSQRPKLQRDLAALLEQDETGVLKALGNLESDARAANLAGAGLLRQVQGLLDYEAAPCGEAVAKYRNSETFRMRFNSGKSAADIMKPRALASISGFDNFILQDDEISRQTVFLEVSPFPICQVKRIRTFVSY